jgi:hypothetical protein
MRALEVLQNPFECSLSNVHKRRREAVLRAVIALIHGGRLWLTALGRSMPGNTSDKHRIKAADRLLGNAKLHSALPLFARALAHRMIERSRVQRPVIAIDWTSLGSKHYVLSAQLCCDGRTLPLYDRVHPKSKLGNPGVQKRFLRELADVLPTHCRPILITDAGFRGPWFEAVRAMGWDFIGRIRNRTHVLFGEQWMHVDRLHKLASSIARDLGELWVGKTNRGSYRLVLSARPKLKGRKRKTRRGTVGRSTTDRRSSSGARQPWLLATSLRSGARAIVRTYRLRMQIEQSFRDTKSLRYGWAAQHARSTSVMRLEVLLMIGALAAFVVQMAGRAAYSCGLHRAFQANTVVTHRVLSFFVLGCLVLRRGALIPRAAFDSALRTTEADIALNDLLLG